MKRICTSTSRFRFPEIGLFYCSRLLKDGTELCRIIGLLTEKKVSDEIVYSTKNISNNEEKNLTLFLETVERTTKQRDLFGSLGNKALRKIIFFPRVLTGLAALSKTLYTKQIVSVPGFKTCNKEVQDPDSGETRQDFNYLKPRPERSHILISNCALGLGLQFY